MKNKRPNFWTQLNKEKGLLLVCFILGFFAWQGIRKNVGIEVPVSNITVDLDVPEGWAVWEKSVHRVNVLFRGTREDIRYLNSDQMRVVIPVPNPKQGDEMVIKLTDSYLRNPTGAKALRFSPSEIVVKLDQESTVTLPVKAALDGSLPDGLEIARIVCTPLSVDVTGAQQVLDGMENIQTEPVELDDRKGSFKESVPIALPQAGRMRVDPDWVTVEFFLEARSATEEFEKIPVRILSAPGEERLITVQPTSVNITVSGQQQRIEQLRMADVFAYVGCYDLAESTGYDLPVVVDLPAGLKLVETEPSVVHVEIGN